jgi:hypothetical protein
MKNLKQRLTARCNVLNLEIWKILILLFPYSGGGTYDKVTSALCFGFGFAPKCISQAQ